MRLFTVVAMVVQFHFAPAQDISFFHLNTSDGLSDNLVTSVVRDKDGLLWVGTAEGLNTFDGFSVKKFYKEQYSQLASNHITDLLCDDKNRIWLRTNNGLITLIDKKRNFISIPVIDSGKQINVSFICKTRSRGIITIFKNKLFTLKDDNDFSFEPLPWQNGFVFTRGNLQQPFEGSDTLIFSGGGKVTIFDVSALRIIGSWPVKNVIAAALLNKNEVLVTTENNRELFKIDFHTGQIINNYGMLNDQYNEPVNGYLRFIRRMKDGRFIISSGYGGVYIFDAVAETITRQQHDALNDRSISANNTFYVYTENSGYVYVTTRSAGLNYFNSNVQLAGYRSAFQETTSGKIFHGFINYVTQGPDGHFWMGTQSRLLEWDREKNYTRFHEYGIINGTALNGTEEVRTICFDKNGNAWLGLNRYGIVVLDRNRKVVKYLDADSTKSHNHLAGNFIHNIVLSPDNKLWVGTAGGLCIINPDTYVVEKSDSHPLLSLLSTVVTYNIWFRNSNEIWVGTNEGAYLYRQDTGEITSFKTENGLSNPVVICFAEDKQHNVYIGTSNGLNIVRNGKVVKVFNRNNGLRSDRCLGLMADKDGLIWIGNDNALLSYNPASSSFDLYDDSYGLSPSGFRLLSYYQTQSGEQLWGSDLGLSYFDPALLRQVRKPLEVRIGSFTAGNKQYGYPGSEKINVAYSQNNLLFSYSAIDLYSSKNLVYEYKLEGADAGWIRTGSPQQVAYYKLKPGQYTFRARVSKEGFNWTEANNPVTITIATPWWKSVWFAALCILAALTSVVYFIRNRNSKIKQQKEELEKEQAINHFATSMSGQGTVDDTLWDVAKNCIGHLGFEDCVIYLLDENKNVLVQKAAWGPKTTEENKILNPLEISLGSGIVGSVAQTGRAEIISDTTKDKRYIVDDIPRFSEIAVPILSDNKVLGVIDSEHSEKGFFTRRHLSVLTTIASLCANKIIRARAEEEKIKAEKNLTETERQTAEMEMQALRAQMNPHFMFNSLNSINNFILKNDPDNASQYLTRFSRLMRLILDNSREEWVLLENEVKALQLYIEMEAIRFDNVFEYEINTASDINPSSVIVPPMIVQPYVENAIWHGLLHRKEPGSKLQVDIWKSNGQLFIKVEDNGVGRENAMMLKGKFSSHKKSHGMQITGKRLDIVNKIYNVDAQVSIHDLKNAAGKPEGTSVILQMKYKTNHNL